MGDPKHEVESLILVTYSPVPGGDSTSRNTGDVDSHLSVSYIVHYGNDLFSYPRNKAFHHLWYPRRMSVSLFGLICRLITELFPDCIAIGTRNVSGSGSWRIVVGVGILWALILGIGILFMPESPR